MAELEHCIEKRSEEATSSSSTTAHGRVRRTGWGAWEVEVETLDGRDHRAVITWDAPLGLFGFELAAVSQSWAPTSRPEPSTAPALASPSFPPRSQQR